VNTNDISWNNKVLEKYRPHALELYRNLALTRALQEGLILERNNIPGAFLTGLGQEVVAGATLFSLWVNGVLKHSPTAFDQRTVWAQAVHVDAVLKEIALRDGKESESFIDFLLRNHFCRAHGCNGGRDGNLHCGRPEWNMVPFLSSHMGVPPAILVGYMEEKMRQIKWDSLPAHERPIAIGYFGDGAAQQGVMHEAMNWAWVHRVPIIFCINDNDTALFTTPKEEHDTSELFRRALGYGEMIGEQVNAMNPLDVISAMERILPRMQDQRVPAILQCCTARLSGHNEDQVRRTSDVHALRSKRNFFDVESIAGLSSGGLEEFRKTAEREPLIRMRKWLITNGFIHSGKGCDAPTSDGVMSAAREDIDGRIARILNEPKITVELDMEDRTVFSKPTYSSLEINNVPVINNSFEHGSKSLGYNKAYAKVVGNLMSEDERIIYFGNDVATKEGGVLGLTEGLLENLDYGRIRNEPISEEMFVAAAVGRALAGGYAIFEAGQFAPFFENAHRSYCHVVSPAWYQKKCTVPMIAVFPSGVVHGGGSGNYHEEWPERYLLPMKGICVVAPANAFEVVGLMRSAYESGWPVAMLLQIAAAKSAEYRSDIPNEPYAIPLGKASVVCAGTDVSVLTYGASCVVAARNEAYFLQEEKGISVEVINARTLNPLDVETVVRSVGKTGRLIVLHEDYAGGGNVCTPGNESEKTISGARLVSGSPGGILLQTLMEHSNMFDVLRAKPLVVGASHPFIPTDLDLVWDNLPYERVMVDEKKRILRSSRLADAVEVVMRNTKKGGQIK
jgi:2-oxoisovalerate dehydrogenase E1 component